MMGLRKHLENTYSRRFKERYGEERLEDSFLILKVAEIKIMSFGCAIVAFASLVFLFGTIIYLERFSYPEYHLVIISLSTLGLCFYLKKSLDVETGKIIFNLMWLINLPLRVLTTGGLLSPLIVGYLAHSIYVYALNGTKWGRLSLFWSVVSIGFFTLIDPLYTFEGSLLTIHPEMQTFLAIVTIFLVTLPILFMFDVKKTMEECIRLKQRKSASYLIMKRLNHEIGNSLYKSLGYLQILRSKKNPQLIPQIRGPLEEIEEVGHALSKMASKGDLEEFLKEHQDEIKILAKTKEALGQVSKT